MNSRLQMTRRRIPIQNSGLAARPALCRRECTRDCRRDILLGVLALAVFAGIARGDETLTAAVQRALAGEPPELVQRLFDEKVVLLSGSEPRDRSGPTQVRALVLFAKPQNRVIQLLLQTARQIEYRPDLEKVETVERFSNGEVDVQEMRIMLVRISYWLRYQWDPSAGRISWELDPRFPNDLRVTDGLWELEEVDALHTLGRFGTRVDVGPALPAFFQEIATRKNLRQTLDRCRRWIDSDGRYRP
jgi:hypothetical protein